MQDSRVAIVHTDWGEVAVLCTRRGLAGMLWPQRGAAAARRSARRQWPSAAPIPPARLPHGLARRLVDYFAGRVADFSAVTLDLSGEPPFRARVLRELHGIEYGRTVSYGQLAGRVGRPRAARAVGQAAGANPIPVIVPCHRVLRGDGGLGGFSADAGVALKARLLEMERAAVAGAGWPGRAGD